MTDWLAEAVERFRRCEGERRLQDGSHKMYMCPAGKWTIGHGWNIEDRGLPDSVVEILDGIIEDSTIEDLDRHLPWWDDAPDAAKAVMYDMMANMGWGGGVRGLSTLRTFLAAMESRSYLRASQLLWDESRPRSEQRYKYSRDVGDRAAENSRMLRGAAKDDA